MNEWKKERKKVLLAGCHFIWTINRRWIATIGKLDKYISKVLKRLVFSLYRSLASRCLSLDSVIQHFHVIHNSIQHSLHSFEKMEKINRKIHCWLRFQMTIMVSTSWKYRRSQEVAFFCPLKLKNYSTKDGHWKWNTSSHMTYQP